jgi:transposase-like protein
VLVAVERNGPVRAVPVKSDSLVDLLPHIKRFVDKGSHLMTDQLHTYRKAGKMFAFHDWVNHGEKEFARGNAHNNTAESFNAILERAKLGVFHYMSKRHLARYLHEVCFRWNHRVPELKRNKGGAMKIVMKPMHVLEKLHSLLSHASGRQLRRSLNGGILNVEPSYGL